MSKVSNSLRILLLLSKNGKMSGEQLARLLELSERSIKKYIEDLLMAGFSIHTIRGRNGEYILDANPLWNSFLKPKELDKLAELVRKQRAIDPEDQVVQQVELKLQQLSNLDHTFMMSSYSVNTDFHHIDFIKKQLKECLTKQFKCIINYHSVSSGSTTRTIHTYHFVYHNAHEYCVAYCEKRQQFLTFKLSRIRSILISDQPFCKDMSFSLEQFLGENSLFSDGYDIEMLVRRDIYVWFRDTKWTVNQTIEEYNDEYYLFKGRVYGLSEVKQFILRFGSNVVVLSPKKLCEEVQQEIKKMLYRNHLTY